MGANNSKPQTVQIPNTSPFQISREVLERVEKAINVETGPITTTCEQCTPPTATSAPTVNPIETSDKAGGEKLAQAQAYQQQQEAAASSFARRASEIEENQFKKTLDRVHHLFGKPIKWAKANECSADIDTMEKQLISCYRQYGTEPLKCADLATQYHTFVFNKQVNSVKNKPHAIQEEDMKSFHEN